MRHWSRPKHDWQIIQERVANGIVEAPNRVSNELMNHDYPAAHYIDVITEGNATYKESCVLNVPEYENLDADEYTIQHDDDEWYVKVTLRGNVVNVMSCKWW